MTNKFTPSRRDVLTTSGLALTTTAMAGCLSSATSGSDETPTATPTEPAATIEVGPDGNLVFEPAELQVKPGATVKWVWKTDNHNVVVDKQPDGADWNGSPGSKSDVHDSGFSFRHTFDTLGTYRYYCEPHKAAGMTGKVVVTESPQQTETQRQHSETDAETEENTPTDDPDTVVDKTGQNEVTVEVGPSGNLKFDPEAFKISPDSTITWVWKTDTHNVVAEDIPKDASWEGTPGGPSKTYDKGYTYEETFSVSGEYNYYCSPHKSVGMTGQFTVE